jgi:two-component system, OmpR family, sensor kinase ParS
MKKLFVRLWLLLVLMLIISYYMQLAVFENWRVETRPAPGVDERARRMATLVVTVLDQYPQADWPSQIDALKQKIGSPEIWLGISRLARLSEVEMDPRLSADRVDALKRGEYQSVIFADGRGYDVFQRIHQTDYVLNLSGPSAQRWPIRVFGVSWEYMSWFVETLIFTIAIWFWLRLFWRDLQNLEAAAVRIGGGNFNTQIAMKQGSALYPLANSFNQMTAKISRLLDSHKQLTNAVSHELRTPISRLRFRYQLAIEAQTIAEKDRALRAMDATIDQLDELSTELLEYAKLDRSEPKLDVGSIDVDPWLLEMTEEGRDIALSTGKAVEIVASTRTAYVEGDYRYLSRAVGNLIRNAVRYSRTQVLVSVDCVDHQFIVTVDDDGNGIPADERERLFEPFARIDQSRDRASGGFGIGLAIVKQVARWHGGDAQIADATIGGARLQISWPVTSSSTH